MDRILKLQKRAIRIVTDSDRKALSKPLFQRLGWVTVTQRADYQTAVLVFKSLRGLAPNYLRNLFSYRVVEHDHCLRSSLQNNILSVPNIRGNGFKSSFSYKGSVTWNSLPDTVRLTTDIDSFKRLCKKHILNF